MTIMNISRGLAVAALAAGLLIGCGGEDAETKKQVASSGVSEAAAAELSTMDLTPDEIQSIGEAKQGGLDDASIVQMVKSVHKRDLKFDLGFTVQILAAQGVGATVMTQLVDLGAIPAWSDDIRALKEKNVGDVTILELAKLRFQQKKSLLSGGEYSGLKTFGLSDAGLLTFVQKGGTPQQLQQLRQELALGKPEPEALKSIGM